MVKGPVSRRRTPKVRRVGIIVASALGVVLLLTGGLYLYAFLQKQWIKYNLDQARESAARTAQLVESAIASNLQALSGLARDTAFIQQLARSDGDPAVGDRFLERFENPLALRFYRVQGDRSLELQQKTLTHAASLMVMKAEATDQPISPEVHFLGTEDERIVFAARVQDADGKMLGTLLLSAATTGLKQALANVDLDGGLMQLAQPLSTGRFHAIFEAGDGGLATRAEPIPGKVSETNWSVKYWSSLPVNEEQQTIIGPGAIMTIGVLALTAMIAVALASTRKKKEVRPSKVTYEGAAKEILDAGHSSLHTLVPDLLKPPNTDAADEQPAGSESANASPPPNDRIDLARELLMPQNADALKPPSAAKPQVRREPSGSIPASIFRAYDIRGVVGDTLTEEGIYQIGRALGTEAYRKGQQSVIVARDGRLSSMALSKQLILGLNESGRDVIDIGMVPTPVLYFATHFLDTGSGIMVTGSHNPKNYNGLKIVIDGTTLSGAAIQRIKETVEQGAYVGGHGTAQVTDIGSEYIRRITEDIPVALGSALKVVVDCGNGVPGILAPQLLRALGHDVVELYCDIDGNFPNHHPDPSQPGNLQDLIATVMAQGADLGLAFDGDGDRLGVVDNEGNIIWPDRQMMLFARDVIRRNPGAQIIFDVKCSNHLKSVIEQSGGKALMWKTGHSLIKAKMKETGALLAGEMSGHIFFKERWYGFDDALYAAARLLEILVGESNPPAEVFAELPGGVATPELRLDMPEERHASFMQTLIERAEFDGGQPSTVDGLRVDFADGWGLIRASNTTPCLVLRFEADDEAALAKVQQRFRHQLLSIDPNLHLPF